MRIDHLAIWVDNLELMRQFYTAYFGFTSGEKYINPKKKFTSYFLSFGEGETRIELMHIPEKQEPVARGTMKGLAHLSISVGGKERVNLLTERLRKEGYTVLGEPRTTGDGYYESVILDPEGNCVEIME